MGIATYSYNRSTSGGEIIRELVNSTDGQGLHFDGAAGYVDIASPPDLGTKFSFEFIAQKDNTAENYLVDFYTGGRFIIGQSSGDANLKIYDNTSWKTFGVAPLDDLKVHHLVVTIDGTAAILYDNGNQVGTVTIGSSHAIDSCTDAMFPNTGFAGTFYRCRFWNKTLTAAEVKATYENATVPFADQYGSQTSLVDAAASVFTSGTYSWVKYGTNTIANVSNTLAITYGDNQYGAYNYLKNASDLTADLTVGKKYRLTLDAKYTGGAAGTVLELGDGASSVYSSELTTSLVNYIFEFTAQSATAAYIQLKAMAASNVVTIDNWYLREIGCVADYELSANPTQSTMVQDRAGAADGTSSASGVTQVTPIEQVNTNKLSVGGTTPLVGIGLAAGVTPSTTLQVAATDGITVGDGTDTDQTILTVDVTGSPTLTWDESDSRFVWIHDQQIKTDAGGAVNLRRTTGDTSGLLGRIVFGNNNIDASLAVVASYQDGATNAGDLRFSTQTAGGAVAERLTIDSAGLATFSNGIAVTTGGVAFPATQSASADANTLDDYEEGTWTPVVAGGTSAGTYTSVYATAYYTKIGRVVTVNFALAWNTHTGTGDLQITGLPFTCLSGSGNIGTFQCNSGLSWTAGSVPALYASGTTIEYRCTDDGGAGVANIQIAATGSYLRGTLTYFI